MVISLPSSAREEPQLAILVNSSDGFSDCWAPFFELFKTYWPDCRFPLYLNTEAVPYFHPSLEIRSLTHPPAASGTRMPWSDRLLASLDEIPEKHVLYMQEDYFIDSPVRRDVVEDCLQVVAHAGVGCVHLTHFGARLGRTVAERPYLVDTPRFSRYRVSTQAAIWNKQVLSSYIRKNESVWETEILGTMRAWHRPAAIRSVDPKRLRGGPIISYTGTGVIRGKWHPAMVQLFASHGIPVEFSLRGFHTFPSRWQTRSRILWDFVRRPYRPLAALLGL